jgi:hypothetical protein
LVIVTTPPMPSHTATLQSPGVCVAATVPFGTSETPHTPPLQVRTAQSESLPGQSAGTVQPDAPPVPPVPPVPEELLVAAPPVPPLPELLLLVAPPLPPVLDELLVAAPPWPPVPELLLEEDVRPPVPEELLLVPSDSPPPQPLPVAAGAARSRAATSQGKRSGRGEAIRRA